MSSAFDFLKEYRTLYERQTDDVEAWQSQHVEAMDCRKVEDAIHHGLTLLAGLRRRTRDWAKEIEAGEPYSWGTAAEQADWYRWWLDRSRLVLKAVERCERSQFEVESAQSFRDAIQEVSLMSLDVDRVKDSLESLDGNRGVPVSRALDELRHRLRSAGR